MRRALAREINASACVRSGRLPCAKCFAPPPLPPNSFSDSRRMLPDHRKAPWIVPAPRGRSAAAEQSNHIFLGGEFSCQQSQVARSCVRRSGDDQPNTGGTCCASRRARLFRMLQQKIARFVRGKPFFHALVSGRKRPALFDSLRYARGNFRERATQQRCGLRKAGKIAARRGQSAVTRDVFHSPGIAAAFQLADQQQAGLPGAREMRAAAGLAVESVDFDGAENSFAFHFLADSRFGKLFRGAEANLPRAILENDFVGAALGFFEVAGSDGGALRSIVEISLPRWNETV